MTCLGSPHGTTVSGFIDLKGRTGREQSPTTSLMSLDLYISSQQ